MYRKLLLGSTLALGCSLVSLTAFADTAKTAQPSVIPKSEWLKSMDPMLPDLICKGFMQDASLKKRFDELQLTYEKCITLIPDSAKMCQDKIYNSIPDTIDEKSASVWGRTLGECIGKDFAEKHLMKKS